MKKYFLLAFIGFFLLFISLNVKGAGSQTDETKQIDINELTDHGYFKILDSWLKQYPVVDVTEKAFTFQTDNIATKDGNAVLSKDETLTYSVTVEKSGLYEIGLKYKLDDDFLISPQIEVMVNDEIQFNEANDITLNVLWENSMDEKYDRYGNQLLPESKSVDKWYQTYFHDKLNMSVKPLKFYLEAGENTIKIKPINVNLYLSDLYINNSKDLENYAVSNVDTNATKGQIVKIQGEDFNYKNNLEIRGTYYKDPGMTPYTYKHRVINILDGDSFYRGGNLVTYNFTVETEGYYKISLKYLQNFNPGITSARRIYVDGAVPFKELLSYQFPSNKKWSNLTLGNDDDFLFFFSEGEHSLSFEVDNSSVKDQIIKLQDIMNEIKSKAVTIRTITGNSTDAFRSWNIVKYMPTIKDDLKQYADEIDEVYDVMNKMNTSSKQASQISSLKIASNQLRRLAEDPNKIPNRMSELDEGSGSSYQLIGIATNDLMSQPLAIDQIYIHNVEDLPKANVNFFVKIWDSIRTFFFSFFDDRYKTDYKNDDETLDVWVGQSPLYIDIMQNMIDEGFTTDTGIPVKLHVLPSDQKIILSNATNTNPDAVLSIDDWFIYDYAIRDILVDLRKYDDFYDTAKNYHPNMFTPMIYDKGVYGMPETQGLYMMYYRKDILDSLDLKAPDTWDDVLQMLPVLQSYHMNFFHPLGGDTAWKGYGMTSPIIYQFGGEIYTDNGLKTVFNEEKTQEAIKFMTDLFTIYDLPLQVPNFFEGFRSGTLPVGISTIDTYLQLKYAAPELSGQWDILPIPGVKNEEGEVERWAPSYGKASIIFKKSNKQDEAWKLIQWWNKEETQVDYMSNIKMYLGERYMFVPAHLEAFENSVWDVSVKDTLLEQARWTRIPAVTPGSYAVERELTNIWNKVVFDKVNPRVAIDEAVPIINRELKRRFTEFGYVQDGVIVKDYVVPNNSNIDRWINDEKEK